MNRAKRHLRKLTIKCTGCDQDIPRSQYDDHIIDIIRSLRQ